MWFNIVNNLYMLLIKEIGISNKMYMLEIFSNWEFMCMRNVLIVCVLCYNLCILCNYISKKVFKFVVLKILNIE